MTHTVQDNRLPCVQAWIETLADKYAICPDSLRPASADASFRRYFRVETQNEGSLIVMDAPPAQESIDSFVQVDGLMKDAGLRVPALLEVDKDQGLILMEDLGKQTYLDVLTEENAAKLMDMATTELVKWQLASKPGILPEYNDVVLRRELDLFPEWYVSRHRGFNMNDMQRKIIQKTFDKLVAQNLSQSRVFVHRDFMPRNLMAPVGDQAPGILDFQDALYGPVSYDIASLLRDAFISWGESFVLDVTIRYWEKARRAGLPVPQDFGEFWKDVEWMGMQRHLKVLGIFARINYRDGKPKYLEDTPRFLHYVRQTANRYDELKPINWLLDHFEEVKSKGAYTF
ncbi:MAG: phosphotransferase [Duodenibacillus sp.]|nr:phosphotransferase [Duodenibacillus sp.]